MKQNDSPPAELPLMPPQRIYTQSHWNHGEAASERSPMSIDKLCDWGERAQPTMPCFQWRGVYAITDTRYYINTQELLHQVEAALKGGIAILQYRNKTAPLHQKKQELQALKELCQAYQRPLLVNDSIDLAQKFSLGVHLGQKDGCAQKAREQLGKEAIIGVTCHDSWELVEKNAPFVDYVALGACFPSHTKPEAIVANHTSLAKIITACQAQFSCKLVGIGGIHADNAKQIVTLGFDYLACISAIWSAPSIEDSVRQLIKNF